MIRAPVAWNKDKLSFTVSDVHKEFNKNKSIITWADGEVEDTTLIEGLPNIYSLSWNQHNQLVYTKDASEKEVRLYDLDTTNDDLLFKNGHSAQWHPNGVQLGYVLKNEMYIYDIPNKTKELIYSAKGENMIDSLSWAPDGEWIAFREGSYENGFGLYVVSTESKTKEQLIEGNVASLSWSPNGKLIAYTTIGSPGTNKLLLFEVPDKYK